MDGRINEAEFADEDVVRQPQFNPQIYLITKNAPKSKVVQCSEEFARSADYPPQYRNAREYHGLITRDQTDALLGNVEGAYLVRASRRESNQLSFTLAFRLFDVTKNYKLKYDIKANVHYLEDGGPETRHYNKVSDMVDDALITYYVESRAADILGRIDKGDFTETGEYASRLDRLDRAAGSRYWTYGCAQQPRSDRASKAPVPSQPPGRPPLGSASPKQIRRPHGHPHPHGYHVRPTAPPPGVAGEPITAFRPIAPGGDSPTSLSHSPSNASADGSPLRSTRTAPSGSIQPGTAGMNQNRYVIENDTDSTFQYEMDASRGLRRPIDVVTPNTMAAAADARQSHVYEAISNSSDTYENNLVSALECEDESVDGRTVSGSAFELLQARDKPHAFAMNNFAGAHFCDFCTHFLWGIIQQGVKCRDCGFKAHKQCALKVPPDCVPAMKHLRRLFGAELTTAALIQPSEKQRLLLAARFAQPASPSNSLSNKNVLISGVPFVVQQCVREVEARGMHFEGIYRIPGNHDDVEALKVAYDRDEPVDLSKVEEVHTVTSVLKNYFRSLPIPLITYEAYDEFIAAVRSANAVREQLREAIGRLPAVHRCTLEYLVRHLARVTDYQPKNMMSAENLSIVFAPTLMRSSNTDPVDSLNNLRFERLVVQRLISDFRELFGSGASQQQMSPAAAGSPRGAGTAGGGGSPNATYGGPRRESCPQATAVGLSLAGPQLVNGAPLARMHQSGLPQSASQCDGLTLGAVLSSPRDSVPPQPPPPPPPQLNSYGQNRSGWDETEIARLSLFRAV